jgi:ubiquinone/menaquinone biosynthesis C-methylase UbiE
MPSLVQKVFIRDGADQIISPNDRFRLYNFELLPFNTLCQLFCLGENQLTALKDSMRRDWDERAKRDAFLYIASWRKDWDEKSFFESGEQDYLRLVQPILQKLQFDPGEKSMAELGCGAGRMTKSFAQRFQTVSAVDISAEMQARAKVYLSSFPNIRWVLSDGETLSGIEDSSLDFVFSYLVLQHFPAKEIVFNSIREMMRILRPGGAFLFQFNGFERPTMNWKGRFISGILDSLASWGLRDVAQPIAKVVGIDPEMIGKTWRGVALRSGEITEVVRSAQALPIEILDSDMPLAWCYGRKLPEVGT